jgi:hypothetical protein
MAESKWRSTEIEADMGWGVDMKFGDEIFVLGVKDFEVKGVQCPTVQQYTEGFDDLIFFHYRFHF